MTTPTTTEPRAMNLRGVKAIKSGDPGHPPELPSYTSEHLRRSLSGFIVRLTRRRRYAALAPLAMAVFVWFSMPAFASALSDNTTPSPIGVVPPDGSSTVITTPSSSPAAAVPAQAPPPAQAPAPAAAAPAVQQAPAAAPAPKAASGRRGIGAPATGINDGGVWRPLLVGLCLLISGLILLTAPKRNPHAIVIRA